jgi:HAE1 family hydrophobic/amphiphilic exporter-1
VNHTAQNPSVTISFNLRPGVALSNAVAAVQAGPLAELPASITTSFQGTRAGVPGLHPRLSA